jgi:3-polyprenyl-4-hydroxybenzoate decarboxylase
VRADDAITDAQAEARALACLFGSKERVKNAFGLADAGPAVGKRNFQLFARAPRSNIYFSVITGFLDGVVSII